VIEYVPYIVVVVVIIVSNSRNCLFCV